MLEVAPKANETDEGAICFMVSAQSFVQMAGTCWLFDGLFSVDPFLTLRALSIWKWWSRPKQIDLVGGC